MTTKDKSKIILIYHSISVIKHQYLSVVIIYFIFYNTYKYLYCICAKNKSLSIA